MPHKHTRREKDPSTFDLPPSQVAKPLPVTSQSRKYNESKNVSAGSATPEKPTKRKRDAKQINDAPRAFKKLMAFAGGKRPRSGLDNGEEPPTKKQKKKKKKNNDQAADASTTKSRPEKTANAIPTIKPGERLSDFAARVDAALPVAGLINKTARNGKDPLGVKVWRTKKERQMHKLYDEWREEERKIRERQEEERELEEEKALEDEAAGLNWKSIAGSQSTGGNKKKKGKRVKVLGEVDDGEDDPWAEIKKKRGEGRIGLHDVAKAPPELKKISQKKLLVRGGATVNVDGVPKAAGSLRRREELQGVRDDVVASYRKMMEGKRPSLHNA